MRLLGLFFAWALATVVAYVLAGVASQQVVLAGIDAYREVPLGTNLRTTAEALVAQPIGSLYLGVIAICFLVGFYVATLVTAALPAASRVAYPAAGATSIVCALLLMQARYDVVPILGAQEPHGVLLQAVAGVVGGIVFELARPKARERRLDRRLR